MLAGKTVENVISLEVLTANGDQFWVGATTDDEVDAILAKDDAQSRIYAQLISLLQ